MLGPIHGVLERITTTESLTGVAPLVPQTLTMPNLVYRKLLRSREFSIYYRVLFQEITTLRMIN